MGTEKTNPVKHPASMRAIKGVAGVGGWTMGDWRKVQDRWGVVYEDAAENAPVNVIYYCKFMKVEKAITTGQTVSEGNNLYLDETGRKVSATKDGTYTLFVGTAKEDAAQATTLVLADINTQFAALTAA